MGVQKRKMSVSAQTLSTSYIHAKSLLYAFTPSSLQLRPANNLDKDFWQYRTNFDMRN